MWLAKHGKGMLSSVEQAFVGRDEKRAPLKTPAWEARLELICKRTQNVTIIDQEKQKSNKFTFGTPRLYQIYYVNIDLRHQYGIKVAESQTFLRAKRPKRRGARWNGWIRRIAGWPLAFHAGVFRGTRLSSLPVTAYGKHKTKEYVEYLPFRKWSRSFKADQCYLIA